jgi:hypothetical protein
VVHVRKPRLDDESHAVGLDRNEVGALLVAAGLAGARDHALVSLLCLNGLRASEAIGADIERLALERGHRTLTIARKGGKVVTAPLAPRTARAIDLAVGERCEGPILVGAGGQRLDRHAAARIVRRLARRAGIAKRVGPHTLRHAFITAALDAGVPLRDVQEAASHADPRTTMRYDRGRVPSTATPPTSWPRSSPEPPARAFYAMPWRVYFHDEPAQWPANSWSSASRNRRRRPVMVCRAAEPSGTITPIRTVTTVRSADHFKRSSSTLLTMSAATSRANGRTFNRGAIGCNCRCVLATTRAVPDCGSTSQCWTSARVLPIVVQP